MKNEGTEGRKRKEEREGRKEANKIITETNYRCI